MKLILLAMLFLITAGCTEDQANETADAPEEATDTEESVNQEQDDEGSEEAANDEQVEDEADEEIVEGEPAEDATPDYDQLKGEIVEQFENATPTDWGENVEGVVTEIDTDDKVVALTFDACDATPDSYDAELIDFLIEEDIPATLFINAQWIEEHEDIFLELAENPLFEIANHGYYHKPLSVDGESAYGIMGTENVEDVFDEIYKNQELITELTGETPEYFRSGTAYYDDVAVEIVEALGLTTINYNVLGDAGGTFNHTQIVSAFESTQPGSIFLFHMNKPNSDISSGVKEGVQMLMDEGYEFVQVGEYDEYFK